MTDISKLEKLRQELKDDFWEMNEVNFVDMSLKQYYDTNLQLWVDNIKKLRNDHPVELNIFLVNIYKSNFLFKLLAEKMTLLNQKSRFTIHDKVRLLKSAFENGYHFFGLLTICSQYKNKFVESLYEEWYIPNSAKETIKDAEKRPWKNDKKENISGKKWVLLNCPLFQFSPLKIEILQEIRNAESHEKLVITELEVILLHKKPYHIKLKEIDKIFKYVRYAMSLAVHFIYIISIKHNFWITPVIIITNENLFPIKSASSLKLPEKEDRRKEKIKPKAKKNSDDTRLFALIFNIFEFLFKTMWTEIQNDVEIIDKFLSHYNLVFDKAKFKNFHNEAILEGLQIIESLNMEIKTTYLNITAEKYKLPESTSDLESFDYTDFFKDISDTLTLTQKSSKAKMKLLGPLIINGTFIFITPIAKIHESLNKVIIPK